MNISHNGQIRSNIFRHKGCSLLFGGKLIIRPRTICLWNVYTLIYSFDSFYRRQYVNEYTKHLKSKTKYRQNVQKILKCGKRRCNFLPAIEFTLVVVLRTSVSLDAHLQNKIDISLNKKKTFFFTICFNGNFKDLHTNLFDTLTI